MLAVDRLKLQYWSPNSFLSASTAAPFAQMRDYGGDVDSKDLGFFGLGNGNALDGCGCGGGCDDCNGLDGYGLSGLGFDFQSFMDLAPINQSGSSDEDIQGYSDALATIAAADPEPISKVALTFTSKVMTYLHIAQGRREADEIVPFQNMVHHQVLEPVYAYMGQGQTLDCAKIAQLFRASFVSWRAWLNFLHNTQWQDGRAATQAEQTLQPYFNTILGSDSGAPGQYAQGGLEQIWNAKACGNWNAVVAAASADPVPRINQLPTTGGPPPPLPPGVQPAIIPSGIINPETIRQFLPFALLGAAVFAVSRIRG